MAYINDESRLLKSLLHPKSTVRGTVILPRPFENGVILLSARSSGQIDFSLCQSDPMTLAAVAVRPIPNKEYHCQVAFFMYDVRGPHICEYEYH
jgi:hypothetical protein